MKDSHEYLEENLRSIIQSGSLQNINLYQVNDTFFELPDEGFWIIDAGIELKFSSGVISAAWSTELESYVIENNSLKDIYEQDNMYQIDNNHISELKNFIGLNVIDVSFKSLNFEYIVDYTMRTEKEKRIVEMVLEFQNKSKIQIAFIDYLLEENCPPKDFSFDIATELLVSSKKVIEIKNVG